MVCHQDTPRTVIVLPTRARESALHHRPGYAPLRTPGTCSFTRTHIAVEIHATPASAADLAARAGTGDERAFELLYRQYAPPLYRWVLSRTRHPQAAEDVCGDVWVRVANGIRSFTPEGSAGFAAWLHRIAHNCLIDRHRAATRRPEVVTPDLLDDGDDDTDAWTVRVAVAEALNQLPRDEAEVIVLRLWVGYSWQAVAEVAGVSEATVRRRYRRGVTQMGTLISPSQPDQLAPVQR